MPTYEFKTIDEFVSYLDTMAISCLEAAKHHHARSHDRAELEAKSDVYDKIANMVRASNLVVVTDYMRAALSKGMA